MKLNIDFEEWLYKVFRNYSGMLIGPPIAILHFLARKITAEGAEERRAYNCLFPLHTLLWLYSVFVTVCFLSWVVPA
jgi:hypothetical protein